MKPTEPAKIEKAIEVEFSEDSESASENNNEDKEVGKQVKARVFPTYSTSSLMIASCGRVRFASELARIMSVFPVLGVLQRG